MKNLNREKSNIIKSGDSANLNIFNQMPYVFTKTDDYVIIEHAADQYYAVTRDQASVTCTSGSSISISGKSYSKSIPVSDIGTIGGVTPSNYQDAVQRLGILFKGYPLFKINVE